MFFSACDKRKFWGTNFSAKQKIEILFLTEGLCYTSVAYFWVSKILTHGLLFRFELPDPWNRLVIVTSRTVVRKSVLASWWIRIGMEEKILPMGFAGE